MDGLESSGTTRRHFLSTIVPACAITCIACSVANAQDKGESKSDTDDTPKDVHPFDVDYPQNFTYREFFATTFRGMISMSKELQKEIGEQETIEFLKTITARRMLNYGKQQASQTDDHSLRQYTEQFREPEKYKNRLIMEIVEDTEHVFELKVTECLWASTFRDSDAAELGVALVCHGDYAWAEGFNSKIKLVRDKTLMGGDAFCNHRYVWQT